MCGICGVFNSDNAANDTYLALHALQHRGSEGAGIAVHDGNVFRRKRDLGLINNIFDSESLDELVGRIGIGGTRYSTIDAQGTSCIQPFRFNLLNNQIATSHNGTITNYDVLRRDLEEQGNIFHTDVDSEIFAHLIAKAEGETLQEKIKDSFPKLVGAYSFIIASENQLIGVRDPLGFRPLELGRLGDKHILSSESVSFDILKAERIRSVDPGEIITISDNGVESKYLDSQDKHSMCIFEYVYFSRPDSIINDDNIDKARRQLGRNLALEHPVDADLVISTPDSANTAALGYSEESSIKYDIGLIRNHYTGRTFISPGQDRRELKVRVKFNAVKGVVEGKKIVVVDDSIVRGTTSTYLSEMLKKADAKEVHWRISSPKIFNPCFYGMDFPTREELLVNKIGFNERFDSNSKIAQHLGADSVEYLSLEGMLDAVPKNGYCTACFSGDYPTKIDF